MAAIQVPIPNVPGTRGAAVSLGTNQANVQRSIDLTDPSGSAGLAKGNQIALYQSQDNFATDNTLVAVFTVGDEQQIVETIAPYYQALRLSGTAPVVGWVGDATPSSGSAATDAIIANGPQALSIPWVVGPADAYSFTLTDNGHTWATSTSGGNTTFGVAGGAQSTEVIAGTGGIGIGVAPTGSSNVNVDTTVAGTGTLNLGATNAGSVNVGNANNSATTIVQSNAGGISALLTGSGGAIDIGGGPFTGFPGIADAIQLLTLNNGPIIAKANGTGTVVVNSITGDVDLGTGAAGVDTNPKTVRVGTGAGAKTILIGSNNTTSATTISYGSGGCGIGTAAPGTSGLALDTPAAGTITIGPTTATTVIIGGNGTAVTAASLAVASGGSISLQTGGAPTATTNIGTATSVQTVNIGSTTGASTTKIAAGTGGIGIGVAAPGGSSTSVDASAAGGALNLGTAIATQVGIGNSTTTTKVVVNITAAGGFGVGVATPDASAYADFNAGSAKGVKFPNMTTTQKNAIAAPAAGLVVFDVSLSKLCVYTGSAWQAITST